MRNKRLNLYFFGEPGNYDDYNPAYICNREHAPEILYVIAANEPFSISRHDVRNLININEEQLNEIINSLKLINAIEDKGNKYRITFPVFLEKDVVSMEGYLSNIGEVIGDRIISLSDMLYEKLSKLDCSKNFSRERVLYHIICDSIFDGTALDFFAARNIFCTSKKQMGNRDYIIIGYEDSELVESHSNKLLCSSNNYRSSGFVFNSFGDSNGLRKDMFRYLRLIQKSLDNASSFHDLNTAYIKVLDNMNRELAEDCGNLMKSINGKQTKYNELTEKEKDLIDFLKELEYVNINEDDKSILINVPLFLASEKVVIDEISDIILSNIFPTVKEIFENFETNAYDLTAVRHRVDIKETANELWHQIFGFTNEYLAEKGFVELPRNIDGEGRYLRSFIIDND